MEFRSTNDNGYSHGQGDIVTNVSSGGPINSSHGVHLTGGSTGGIVQPAGDETNIALNVRGKGSGLVNIAGPTAQITLNSTGVNFGSRSTSALAYIQRYRVDYTLPAVSSAGAAGCAVDSTVTVLGATTNAMYIFQETQRWNSTQDPGLIVTVRCSTADELKVTTLNVGPSSLSGSTVSGNLLQFGW